MARLSDRVVVALQCQAISWAIQLKVAFGGKQGNRNWLISRIRETNARRIIRLCTKRGSRALTGGGSNACAATWPGRPWREGVCASSMPTLFPSRSKRRGRMGPALSCCLRWNCWRSGGSGSPAPVSSPALPRGPGAPGPGPRAHRAGPTGCRAGGGGRLGERCVLRPSTAVGDPAGAGVFLRPQRMRGLWRSPENHRRPDRSGFDPALSGGGRAAGDAPAESPASAAVRVRRLTSSRDPLPAP